MKNRKIQYGVLNGSVLESMTGVKSEAVALAQKTGHQAVKLLPSGWMVGMKNETLGLAWK